MQDTKKEKKQLRRELEESLRALSPEERAERSKQACRNLVSTQQFIDASTIMIYLSLPHEVDTAEAILHAWQMDKIVVVPKISWQQRHMIPVRINTLETGFSTEVTGLRNPVTGTPIPPADIDMVITPALGVDSSGNRLGRGGSFYDNFFVNPQLNSSRCGLVFSEQVIERVPITDHDQPLDLIVTDKEVIYHKGHRSAKAQTPTDRQPGTAR